MRNELRSVMSDAVQVVEMWQATCDACGWHTQPASPMEAVREWARLHRSTCPLKTGWTPDQCRAARWEGHPVYEGAHQSHQFHYGPDDRFLGNCGGRR